MTKELLETLSAPGPHPSLGTEAETYGRLIGSWAGTLRDFDGDALKIERPVEIHFAWVLEGRAVQDVWISPGRLYGSTLRVFEPARAAWHVTWLHPATGVRSELEGRRVGDDVVQLGLIDGRPARWTFSRIRPDSFLWQGHILETDGETWRLAAEFDLTRA
jgi:hypothetical protein